MCGLHIFMLYKVICIYMQGTSIGVISTLLRPFVCRCVARMLDLPDAFPAKRSGDSIEMRPLIPSSMYYDVGWRA